MTCSIFHRVNRISLILAELHFLKATEIKVAFVTLCFIVKLYWLNIMELWLHKESTFIYYHCIYLFLFPSTELRNLGVISAWVKKKKNECTLWDSVNKQSQGLTLSYIFEYTDNTKRASSSFFSRHDILSVLDCFSQIRLTQNFSIPSERALGIQVSGETQLDSSKPGSSLICSTQLFAARGLLWGSALIDSDGKSR